MHRTVRVLALIALLLGVLAACGPESLGPKETAAKFLGFMVERNLTEAYNLLSSDSKATVTAEAFDGMVRKAWAEANIIELKVKSIQDDAVLSQSGTRASVAYCITITTNDEKSTDVYNAINLVNDNGRWGVIWPPVR